MTNQPKLWIVKKRKNYTILKLQDGKRVQLAKFQSKQDAIKYRQNYIVAVASEKIASVDYDFHQLFLKFSNIKNDGGENIDTCLTKSGGSRYLAHYNHYLVPYLDPCKLHEIGGKRLQSFVDKFLGTRKAGTYDPTKYKTCKLVLANIRRFLKWCLSMEYHTNFQSALAYRIPTEQRPDQADLRDVKKASVISPADAKRLLDFVWDHRKDSVHAFYACAIFHILFYFGFRSSEILGLRKTDINLQENYFFPQGMFDKESYTYRSRTKNAGSKRKVFFDPTGDAKQKLAWILGASIKFRKDNPYLIPATRGNNPLSSFMFRKILYATYEHLGMAKIKWTRERNDMKFTIISSPFTGCPSKTWRHLKAAQLIKGKEEAKLSENYIKRVMGHDLYSTTRDIYGNHDIFDLEEHYKIASSIEKLRLPQN